MALREVYKKESSIVLQEELEKHGVGLNDITPIKPTLLTKNPRNVKFFNPLPKEDYDRLKKDGYKDIYRIAIFCEGHESKKKKKDIYQKFG